MNVSFILHPIAPFRLDYTVVALRRRNKNCVDCWNGQYYTRVFNIHNKLIKVMVEQTNSLNNPELRISLAEPIHPVIQEKIKHLIELMLGLNRDLTDFYKMAKNDARLSPLVVQFIGVKPPRFPSLFEALVNAISCQQISLDAGLHIQNRLVQHIGMKMNDNNQVLYAFPSAEDVCHCSVAELKILGYSTPKSETIIRVASTLKEEQLFFNRLEEKPNQEVIQILCQFKGIGRWTAEYVLLRGLGRVDIFPRDDIGAQNNLQKLFHLEEKLDYKKTSEITALWHPYAGLVYFHLLLQRLYEKGVLQNAKH
ncbi:DNA-3-methyladenine glycosylase family protein [Legionella sainthelensi]|uniref:DNA-3-methyladenine glycosylase family protein n=1 Tax=Legionella sainthelensi TaxID=28087 RepID=UPI000E1FCB60|nr:DNA-3-methyladenine glycosylase [Legionella sainthelensi]